MSPDVQRSSSESAGPADSHPASQSLPSTSSPGEPDQALAQWLNASRWVSTGLICLFLVAAPTCLLAVWEQERDKRKCGVDWMLWLAGSDRTFESTVLEAIENSRKDSPFPSDDSKRSIKDFDFNKPLEFDMDQFNFSDSILYKPDGD
jgi:hypothetical protein